MITSFDYNVLVKVKALEPSFKTGYITSRDIGDPGQYVAADQFMISIELVRKELVDRIHGLGKKAVAWTINDAYSLKKCEEAQVDNMITDKPGSSVVFNVHQINVGCDHWQTVWQWLYPLEDFSTNHHFQGCLRSQPHFFYLCSPSVHGSFPRWCHASI